MGREREQTGEVHLETVLKPFLIPFHSRTNGKFCKQDPYRLSGMPFMKVDMQKEHSNSAWQCGNISATTCTEHMGGATMRTLVRFCCTLSWLPI